MQELVQVYKALSDPTRLRMLHLLTRQPLCVCHFQGILNLAQVPVSQHLAYLRKIGLVEGLRHAQAKSAWRRVRRGGRPAPAPCRANRASGKA